MRRFNKILVVYDLAYGGDETLERALELVQLNGAELTVLHVIGENKASPHLFEERERLMSRLISGLEMEENHLDVIVKSGNRVNTILETAENKKSDLIVVPTEYKKVLAQLMGTDTVAELMRLSKCPVWVVRPNMPVHYKKIVAAVNAGKSDALECAENRRILQMASSLAEIEGADLDVLYAYDYSKEDDKTLASEVPDQMRNEIVKKTYNLHLEKLKELMDHVFDKPLMAKPVALQGDLEDVVVDYLKDSGADLLVIEEKPDSPLVTAIVGNPVLRLLHEASCAVLISRPAPEYGVKSEVPKTQVVQEKTTFS